MNLSDSKWTVQACSRLPMGPPVPVIWLATLPEKKLSILCVDSPLKANQIKTLGIYATVALP